MDSFSILLGKGIQKISKLRGGGGSALPGLFVEKTNPNFLRKTLSKLPYGVVVISGTNGKTTTTKIVSELLAKQGLKVFTNKTGSNFVRGAISAILEEIKVSGKFDYDIAVLELDEAHAVKFCENVPVNYSLILNVQRDQLDRFGEIDHTAELLEKLTTSTKKCVVLNREDSRVAKLKGQKVIYYGLNTPLQKNFPNDDNLLDAKSEKKSNKKASVTLDKLKGQIATYDIEGQKFSCDLTLKGIYNAYNAAGALALCHEIMPEILLVKNPAAFQLSLASFADNNHEYMIAINDETADGHDVSWLWNVDFKALPRVKYVSGTRAADMALRLKYDEIPVDGGNPDITIATNRFMSESKNPKRIFATYTAMLEIRKIITGKSLL